jgi:WhiB family redox-sensing transcriptional regulator
MVNWQDRALCAQVDPELWFPEKGQTSQALTAKRICRRCPVRADCLAAALEQHAQDGIWGGLTYYERLDLDVPQPARRLKSARAHARLLTALPVPEAARELGVSERTIARWRAALAEAS